MIQFAVEFPDEKIVATLWRQLSWSYFKLLIPLKDNLQRDFYAQICRIENWNVATLGQKMQSTLFERTGISKKPAELAKLELQILSEENKMTPDLVFRDPYILDFLGLKDAYLENDLEQAILRKLEQFILELGAGFAFLARQKRMIIDGKDFNLDLLFYHRKLKRLIAIDLKIGPFEAAYKGQMELYLRWLEKNKMEEDEASPIGLILCAGGNREQVELLQLDPGKIKVAEYITEYLPKKLLKEKLHQFVLSSKNQLNANAQPNNEQALESTIEKRLTGISTEEIKDTGNTLNTSAERVELYRKSNGYVKGYPSDFNPNYAIDEIRFWEFLKTTSPLL